jgi:hypothetical protein
MDYRGRMQTQARTLEPFGVALVGAGGAAGGTHPAFHPDAVGTGEGRDA